MSNKNKKTIHEFDFSLICEYFSSLDRQGPGSDEVTKLALRFINGISTDTRIADLGCGTGGQTVTLAKNTPVQIVALDLFPAFINQLTRRAAELGLANRIETVVGSMGELPFAENRFDVIWSEGAIYNIGFQHGLEYWRRFIKTGGYIAVTEASWLTVSRPEEIEQFWMDAYPEIDTISNKVQQMQTAGYVPIATFVLPEECWTDNFYLPQKSTQKLFLENHPGKTIAEDLVRNMRHEAELYSKYKQFYGYVFYIGKKI
jgi:ubiquinone/menaquinone biosynthesis C-methylase UbiE